MGKVACLGSINVDLVATMARFPRPGETVLGTSLTRYPGGKGANQAIAAARMGVATMMAGCVGDDESGRWMIGILDAAGVDATRVESRGGVPTGTAIIRVCAGENDIVVVAGANAAVDRARVDSLSLAPGDVLLCQLEVPVGAAALALARSRDAGAMSVLNAAPALPEARALAALADVLIVNETELSVIAGQAVDPDASIAEIAGIAMAVRNGTLNTIVTTLGARGAVMVSDAAWSHIDGRVVEVVDTTGAGDCFCGVLAASLAHGMPMSRAVARANAAAAISVTRPGAGASMPGRAEVDRLAGT